MALLSPVPAAGMSQVAQRHSVQACERCLQHFGDHIEHEPDIGSCLSLLMGIEIRTFRVIDAFLLISGNMICRERLIDSFVVRRTR